MMVHDTIAAISTPVGVGGIGIVRVSGELAIALCDTVFHSKKGTKLCNVCTHTIHYGHIVSDGQVVDEVLVSVMLAPKTFTGEHTVEINCHGGILSTSAVLTQVIHAGARLAENGEFTKRAFLNGKMDLSQAEAVIDVINAKTDSLRKHAVGQLGGSILDEITKLRNQLLTLVSHLQAAADFPEEDIPELEQGEVEIKLTAILSEMTHLLNTADYGKIVREGLSTIIVGKPNVGKSSLLNAMLKENRAIVTEIAGTTRDVIEEYINLRGVALRMMDTAGIRETDDLVEKIGVERSKAYLEQAELVLLMLDGSQPLCDNDRQMAELVAQKKVIICINKADLGMALDIKEVQKLFKGHPILHLSATQGQGIAQLEQMIADMFFSGAVVQNMPTITNIRHKQSLMHGQTSLQEALTAFHQGMPIDIIAIDLQSTVAHLGEIVGLTVSEEIIDRIFHDFCLGK
ncbi:MAG: tRNA uridine-5-carboxymethylaminomethyl(34) synthesis GTPase MnmE [Hyphomonadaceae bacterium]|nr:tRNA uridine-5-carboxymethylaminomethyl(34) synthesis GTPase MnmE [Clostridia bacterium]